MIYGNRHIFIADSTLVQNEASMLFHIIHNWWRLGIESSKILYREIPVLKPNVQMEGVYFEKKFILFENKKIFLADKDFKVICKPLLKKWKGNKKMEIDYLIISENAIFHITELTTVFTCKKIIIDSSNSLYQAKQWVVECKKLGISCYSVLQQGAFIERP